MISNHEFIMLEIYVHAVAAKHVALAFKNAETEKPAKRIEEICRQYLTGKATFIETMKMLDALIKEKN